MMTYGVDYFKGQSSPFKDVTSFSVEINGKPFEIADSPLYNYDPENVIAMPNPESLPLPVAFHAIGIDRDLAYALCNQYQSVLRDRTDLHDIDTLKKYPEIQYESLEVIDHAVAVARTLLEHDTNMFQFQGGISLLGIQSVQIAFGRALEKLTSNDIGEHLSGEHRVFMTTVGSYIDSFDNFDEFHSINMAPAVTPRIVESNRIMGKGGDQLNFESRYALIIPVDVSSLEQ